MTTVAIFNHECSACKRVFVHPHLGDFSYGDFIFSGEQGTVVAYSIAIDNPSWNFLATLLTELPSGVTAQNDRADLLQGAFAHFADPINGQRLCNFTVCPHCLNGHGYRFGESIGWAEIPTASHEWYSSLPEAERARLASAYFQAQQVSTGGED